LSYLQETKPEFFRQKTKERFYKRLYIGQITNGPTMEKRMLSGILGLIALLVMLTSAEAAIYHVTETGSGNMDGSDWNNAFAGLPGMLERGSTYYLADGSYPGYTLKTPENNSLWITIRKATETEHGVVTGWNTAMGDGIADFTGPIFLESGHFELDGAKGGGPGSWREGHGIRFSLLSGNAISAYKPLVGIKLKNIEVTQPGEIRKMGGLNAWKNPFFTEDFYIGYCYFHHISGLPIFAREGKDWLFEYNLFADPCGVSLYDHNQHCEHLVSHDADDVTIRFNIMTEGRSTGILVNNDRRADRWKVYGNVFQMEEGSAIVSAASDPADTAYDWNIFNNVFIGPGPLKIIISSGKVYNNIYLDGPAFPPGGEHDYNYYANITFAQCNMRLSAHENGNSRYPSNCDTIAVSQSPLRSDDYGLISGIDGWPGIDVCSIPGVACMAEDRYDYDWNGNRRGADGVWDRGALEFVSGACTPSCSGKACGPDGCGGSCGTCGADYDCVLGNCQRAENCNQEMLSAISAWKAGDVTLAALMETIRIWKSEC
jgi:hypothetical protein